MKILILFMVMIAVSVCHQSRNKRPIKPSEEGMKIFQEWKIKFGKIYSTQAQEHEAAIKLLDNKARIDEHNQKFSRGEVFFTQVLNKYSDMTSEELQKYLTGLAVPPEELEISGRSSPPTYKTGPSSVDWKTAGLVGPVLDQGSCNSCWAFSAAGVVEGILRRKKINEEVSPQQLIDCKPQFCWGCDSGWPKYALDYIKTKGISVEKDYPYKGKQENCTYDEQNAFTYIDNVYIVPTRGNETLLRDIVASVGPVSVVMCLEESFYNYQSGVYHEENCCDTISHAMLIVGYGTDPVGGDYWLIKNSWGEFWGEKGFIKVARNKNNMCNVAYYAVYAT